MSGLAEFIDLSALDTLAYGDSPLHRLDPRTKVVVTGLFVATVVSFPKYAVTPLIPCWLVLILGITLGDLPIAPLFRRVGGGSVFAVLLATFNPLFDTRIVTHLGSIPISAGWVSGVSIVMRCALTLSCGLVLIATTPLPDIARALERLRVPGLLVTILMLVYRYVFVLSAEGDRMLRARDLRTFGRRGRELHVAAALLGTLLVRTLERAERIHHAMLARGFTGALPSRRGERMGRADVLCLAGTALLLGIVRSVDLVQVVATLVSSTVS
jgi:cobalt/nickel transport system permease protein